MKFLTFSDIFLQFFGFSLLGNLIYCADLGLKFQLIEFQINFRDMSEWREKFFLGNSWYKKNLQRFLRCLGKKTYLNSIFLFLLDWLSNSRKKFNLYWQFCINKCAYCNSVNFFLCITAKKNWLFWIFFFFETYPYENQPRVAIKIIGSLLMVF